MHFAQAGMNQRNKMSALHYPCVSRVRGDEPNVVEVPQQIKDVFPAWAGII
jgi:hypothetical protein